MHTSCLRPLVAAAVAAGLSSLPAAAQAHPESVSRWLDGCRDNGGWGDTRERHCEVRSASVPRGTRSLDIDGRQNGGIRVIGWDRDSIAVFALINTQARYGELAREMAEEISISTSGGRIRADGDPDRRSSRSGYSVSFHVYAPRRMDVEARTHNGGISVDGINGVLDIEAHNGGLSLADVSGDLRGRTTNGGITLALTGSRWEGRGVDLETTNGGVTVSLPENFNARLETATVNGGMNIDFPITLQGRIGREIRTTLGDGGPLVRVTTTNGGVRIRRR